MSIQIDIVAGSTPFRNQSDKSFKSKRFQEVFPCKTIAILFGHHQDVFQKHFVPVHIDPNRMILGQLIANN
jgi:hypothetical protein